MILAKGVPLADSAGGAAEMAFWWLSTILVPYPHKYLTRMYMGCDFKAATNSYF